MALADTQCGHHAAYGVCVVWCLSHSSLVGCLGALTIGGSPLWCSMLSSKCSANLFCKSSTLDSMVSFSLHSSPCFSSCPSSPPSDPSLSASRSPDSSCCIGNSCSRVVPFGGLTVSSLCFLSAMVPLAVENSGYYSNNLWSASCLVQPWYSIRTDHSAPPSIVSRLYPSARCTSLLDPMEG